MQSFSDALFGTLDYINRNSQLAGSIILFPQGHTSLERTEYENIRERF